MLAVRFRVPSAALSARNVLSLSSCCPSPMASACAVAAASTSVRFTHSASFLDAAMAAIPNFAFNIHRTGFTTNTKCSSSSSSSSYSAQQAAAARAYSSSTLKLSSKNYRASAKFVQPTLQSVSDEFEDFIENGEEEDGDTEALKLPQSSANLDSTPNTSFKAASRAVVSNGTETDHRNEDDESYSRSFPNSSESNSFSSDLDSTAPLHRVNSITEQSKPRQRQGTSFVDRVSISVRGGKGGPGCASYERLRDGYGAPNGGDGGDGGGVYVETDASLSSFRFPSRTLSGGNGNPGGSDNCRGANGAASVVMVPVGTVIHQVLATNDTNGKLRVKTLYDLDEPATRVKLCDGGAGGEGNRAFTRLGYRPNTTFSSFGESGQEKTIIFELKSIADVGLVGYPNAGKSSLLSCMSAARPKIAPYPFTTLAPNLGIVSLQGANHAEHRYSVADLPGLIDGAHDNRGLGHEFLRHIERTKLLLYVLDIAGSEQRDPVEDFKALQREIYLYDKAILRRPAMIFANKSDLTKSKSKANFKRLQQVTDLPAVLGSCESGEGIDRLKELLWKSVQREEQKREQLKKLEEQAKEQEEQRQRELQAQGKIRRKRYR